VECHSARRDDVGESYSGSRGTANRQERVEDSRNRRTITAHPARGAPPLPRRLRPRHECAGVSRAKNKKRSPISNRRLPRGSQAEDQQARARS